MSNESQQTGVLKDQERIDANNWLVDFMQKILEDGREEVDKLQRKLSWTYTIIIALSILMFFVGIGLLITSAVKEFKSSGGIGWQSFTIGGLGIADFVGLYFFRPIEQIRKIMADMSQLTVAINSHQTQVSLRLLETDSTNRATIGEAAEHIKKTARDSLEKIQKYFEEGEEKESKKNTGEETS